jgi:hypothetical protein
VSPAEARAILLTTRGTWSDADLVRLATLIQFGPPADVVYSNPAKVNVESGDGPGTIGLREETTPESQARASALDMWRQVSALAGFRCPLRMR